jgi:hypothetical protein
MLVQMCYVATNFRDLLEFQDFVLWEGILKLLLLSSLLSQTVKTNGTVTVILTALADGLYSLTYGFFPLNPTGVRLSSNSNSKGVSFYENGSVFVKKETVKIFTILTAVNFSKRAPLKLPRSGTPSGAFNQRAPLQL